MSWGSGDPLTAGGKRHDRLEASRAPIPAKSRRLNRDVICFAQLCGPASQSISGSDAFYWLTRRSAMSSSNGGEASVFSPELCWNDSLRMISPVFVLSHSV
jgi:hypothetical protein